MAVTRQTVKQDREGLLPEDTSLLGGQAPGQVLRDLRLQTSASLSTVPTMSECDLQSSEQTLVKGSCHCHLPVREKPQRVQTQPTLKDSTAGG